MQLIEMQLAKVEDRLPAMVKVSRVARMRAPLQSGHVCSTITLSSHSSMFSSPHRAADIADGDARCASDASEPHRLPFPLAAGRLRFGRRRHPDLLLDPVEQLIADLLRQVLPRRASSEAQRLAQAEDQDAVPRVRCTGTPPSKQPARMLRDGSGRSSSGCVSLNPEAAARAARASGLLNMK